jgi:NADH-quinone oxidoreductase subunit L
MLLLPVIASLVAGFFGRYLGIRGTNFIVLSCLFISTLLSLILGYEVILAGSSVSLRLGS